MKTTSVSRMASSALQICAFLMALAGFTIVLIATMSNTWKVSATAAAPAPAGWVSEGLWMDCEAAAFGSVQCKQFLYMLSSDSKCAWYMYVKPGGVMLFLLSGWFIYRGCHRGSSMERICPMVLAGRLKGPSEIHVLHPAIQLGNCCDFIAISVVLGTIQQI